MSEDSWSAQIQEWRRIFEDQSESVVGRPEEDNMMGMELKDKKTKDGEVKQTKKLPIAILDNIKCEVEEYVEVEVGEGDVFLNGVEVVHSGEVVNSREVVNSGEREAMIPISDIKVEKMNTEEEEDDGVKQTKKLPIEIIDTIKCEMDYYDVVEIGEGEEFENMGEVVNKEVDQTDEVVNKEVDQTDEVVNAGEVENSEEMAVMIPISDIKQEKMETEEKEDDVVKQKREIPIPIKDIKVEMDDYVEVEVGEGEEFENMDEVVNKEVDPTDEVVNAGEVENSEEMAVMIPISDIKVEKMDTEEEEDDDVKQTADLPIAIDKIKRELTFYDKVEVEIGEGEEFENMDEVVNKEVDQTNEVVDKEVDQTNEVVDKEVDQTEEEVDAVIALKNTEKMDSEDDGEEEGARPIDEISIETKLVKCEWEEWVEEEVDVNDECDVGLDNEIAQEEIAENKKSDKPPKEPFKVYQKILLPSAKKEIDPLGVTPNRTFGPGLTPIEPIYGPDGKEVNCCLFMDQKDYDAVMSMEYEDRFYGNYWSHCFVLNF